MLRSTSKAWRDWEPSGAVVIRTIDAHAEGEPLRVILDGMPEAVGTTILERRRHARETFDHLRTALMWEPRGHADMYGCIVTKAVTAGADFGVLFLHNEGYSTMCGHGIIAVATVVIETGAIGAVEPVTELSIDTPAGLVAVRATVEQGRVQRVAFSNVPSFVVELGATVSVPGIGDVRYDLAFGGAFYAYVDAASIGLECSRHDLHRLIGAGSAIKRAVSRCRSIEHPEDHDLGFLYGTIFTGPAAAGDAHSRNVCVFADGEVDRSPTGTGVSGRLAIHHARGEIAVGDAITIESIIGSRFTGRVIEETSYGPWRAVIPEVEGSAFITGRHEFVIQADDPLADGFLLR